MDNFEYIPLDLVMTKTEPNNFVPNGVVCEFVSYGNRNKVFVRVAKGIDTFFLEKGQITPIPLTPEILEKNGWKRNGGQYSFTYKPYAGGKVELIGFFIEMFKDVHDMLKHRCFQITHENKVICGCFYVHEIQHLLFGLGLNSEMEV